MSLSSPSLLVMALSVFMKVVCLFPKCLTFHSSLACFSNLAFFRCADVNSQNTPVSMMGKNYRNYRSTHLIVAKIQKSQMVLILIVSKTSSVQFLISAKKRSGKEMLMASCFKGCMSGREELYFYTSTSAVPSVTFQSAEDQLGCVICILLSRGHYSLQTCCC